LEYDANSLLYVSKAVDLFDLGARNTTDRDAIRAKDLWKIDPTFPEDARSTLEVQEIDPTLPEDACSTQKDRMHVPHSASKA